MELDNETMDNSINDSHNENVEDIDSDDGTTVQYDD